MTYRMGNDDFVKYLECISHLDFIGAKAHLAMLYSGQQPSILPYPHRMDMLSTLFIYQNQNSDKKLSL